LDPKPMHMQSGYSPPASPPSSNAAQIPMGVPAVDSASELISINGTSQEGDRNRNGGDGDGDYSAAPVMSLDDLVGGDVGAGLEKGSAPAAPGFGGAGVVGTDEEKEMEFMLQMSSVQHRLDEAVAEKEAVEAEKEEVMRLKAEKEEEVMRLNAEKEAAMAEIEKEREAMRVEREELAHKLKGEILLKEAATASAAEVMKKMEGDAVERRKVGGPRTLKIMSRARNSQS
jgi:hypothetical protein